LKRVIKAAETVDACTKAVVETGLQMATRSLSLPTMVMPIYDQRDGSPNTAHTTNLVPCIIIDKDVKDVKDGKLGDIAPTVLNILGVARRKYPRCRNDR
jgi:2,3-bisphosphoglycerate-independent phosphoglycerate mutase